MFFFRQTFATILLLLLSFFIVSPSFALGSGEDMVVVMNTRSIDDCTVSIQCHDIGDGRVVCRSVGEVMMPLGCSMQGLSGNNHPAGNGINHSSQIQEIDYIASHEIPLLYSGPDAYLYPFVSIIKIQV